MKHIFVLFIFIVNLYSSSVDNYPFDKNKLDKPIDKSNTKSYVGIIKNQVWIYSKTLQKEKLKNLVLKMYDVKIVGYDKTYGLLIEFDDNIINPKQLIDKLSVVKNIDNVFHRVYIGTEAMKPISIKIN